MIAVAIIGILAAIAYPSYQDQVERSRRTDATTALLALAQTQERIMAKYAVGDHVSWNSEAGRVSGTISKIHDSDFDYKGHTRRASKDEPQYEIESDKTDHVAAHKEGALTKLKS